MSAPRPVVAIGRGRRRAAVAALLLSVGACSAGPIASERASAPTSRATPRTMDGAMSSSAPLLTKAPAVRPPSDSTTMRQVDYLTGGLSPKSVVANGHGAVIANNMMYNHSVTLYDAATRHRVATVSDEVDLGALGVSGGGRAKGAPVEAAFTKDGRYAYVSNYSMYGSGFGPEGKDSCTPNDGTSTSFVYRLDLGTQKIDRAMAVGAVPKYVALTPDQSRVLVTNWCSWTLTVLDRESGRTLGSVPIAAYPRGIAVSPDSRYAYVTAMGTSHVYRVDLRTLSAQVFASPGTRVRHVVLGPNGRYLYAVSSGHNSGDGTTNVAKIDALTGTVVAQVTPGREPRSLAISADGRALYVVNYDESSVVKIRSDDMTILQRVRTDAHPIGVAYEPTTGTVWVCAYGGAIHVLDDTGAGGASAVPSRS